MKHRNPLVEFLPDLLFTASAFALDADTAQLQFENGTFTLHSKCQGKESFQGEFQVLDGLTGQLFQQAEALTNSLFEWRFQYPVLKNCSGLTIQYGFDRT